MEAIKRLTDYFKGEVGYLEKQTTAHLDDKTANAGDRNYTKYGAYFGHNGPDAYWHTRGDGAQEIWNIDRPPFTRGVLFCTNFC